MEKEIEKSIKYAKIEFYVSIAFIVFLLISIIIEVFITDEYLKYFRIIYLFILIISIIRMIVIHRRMRKSKKEMKRIEEEIMKLYDQMSEDDKKFARQLMPWRFKNEKNE